MPLQEDYRITLDAFQGPLDLLLFLVRRAEVDIADIPVTVITDQYLEFLSQVDDVDVDVAGEFLVMAATLIELKSRTLVPPESVEGDDAGDAGGGTNALESTDPRYELVRQLLEYQRFRIAGEELVAQRDEFARRYPLRVGPPGQTSEQAGEQGDVEAVDAPDEPDIELDDVHLLDLADAYERIMLSIDFDRLGDHVIAMDDTPIELHQEDLLDRLRRSSVGRLTLQEAFAGQEGNHRVGLFLATLELARTRRVTVVQEELESPIELVLRSADPTESPTGKQAERRPSGDTPPASAPQAPSEKAPATGPDAGPAA